MDGTFVALGETEGPDGGAWTLVALRSAGLHAVVEGTLVLVIVDHPSDVAIPYLATALGPSGPPVRWGIGIARAVDGARGRAESALRRSRAGRVPLAFETGDVRSDALLGDLAPVLAALVDGLTARQAEIARAIVVAGNRQAHVAHALGVSRASVSVAAGRAHVTAIRHAAAAIGSIAAQALARTEEPAGALAADGPA